MFPQVKIHSVFVSASHRKYIIRLCVHKIQYFYLRKQTKDMFTCTNKVKHYIWENKNIFSFLEKTSTDIFFTCEIKPLINFLLGEKNTTFSFAWDNKNI